MQRFARLLAVPVAAVLGIGCDSVTPARTPEPAKAEAPQSIAKAGPKVAPRKKRKEAGLAPESRRPSIEPRSDL
jgi:hypothetical protein